MLKLCFSLRFPLGKCNTFCFIVVDIQMSPLSVLGVVYQAYFVDPPWTLTLELGHQHTLRN